MRDQELLLPIESPSHSWRLVGKSVPGTSHRCSQKACEDAHGWFDTSSGLVAVAVSDGAGSAPFARVGSATAVRAALLYLLNAHWECPITADNASTALKAAFEFALRSLSGEAEYLKTDISALACTLIVGVAGRSFAAVAHVGDGAFVTRDQCGNLLTLSPPVNGEFANETPLLGCNDPVDLTIWSISPIKIKDFAVFTDGAQRIALNRDASPHDRFFDPLFDLLRVEPEGNDFLAEFLMSPEVASRTADDLTMLTAHFE